MGDGLLPALAMLRQRVASDLQQAQHTSYLTDQTLCRFLTANKKYERFPNMAAAAATTS